MCFFLLREELGAGEVRACSVMCSSLGFFFSVESFFLQKQPMLTGCKHFTAMRCLWA